MGSWVSWFCSMKGNEFFCEVDEDYIQDDFNLSGLSSQVPYYDYALEVILDADSFQDEMLTETQQAAVEAAAETLYGLIHARFILTSRGLAAMADKFRSCDFGRCPRVLCNGQPCLPVGLSDVPRQSTVKLFCPRCEDAFYPRSKYHGNIDGAYFGTTFPHLFCLTYPSLKPQKPPEKYVPRVFGFKISPLAYNRQQQQPDTSNAPQTREQQPMSRDGSVPDTSPAALDTQQRTSSKSHKKNDTSTIQEESSSMRDATDAGNAADGGGGSTAAKGKADRKKSKK